MHPIAPFARTAYATGVAVSGGPITDRVKAGCVAAVAYAVDHADDPNVLEVALHLGKLEGAWAVIYQRRERLHAGNDAAAKALWAQLVQGAGLSSLVATVRQHLGLAEAAGGPSRAAGDWISARVRQFLDATLRGGWDRLRNLVRSMTANGRAEGAAAALALAAEERGVLGFAFDLAFKDAYAALGDVSRLVSDADADAWLSNLLGDVSDQVGARLAALAADGASRAEMLTAVEDLVGEGNARSVAAAVDLLTSRAMSQGALDLYQAQGVEMVDFLTAGDQVVCYACDAAEANGPYALTDAPTPGLHPNCVVGSTRVVVPRPVTVAGRELARLALADAAARTVAVGDRGALTAATVTEAGLDFGRSNLRAVTVREYVGQLVTVRTALGHELTGTPNHPVATRRGWVPLAELAVGDHVLSSTAPEWVVQPVDPDVDDVPPRIEDVAQTFPMVLGPVPTAAEDFHGDGAGSDVHVVRTDRLLLGHGAAAFGEHVCEDVLGGGDVAVAAPLIGEGDLASGLDALGLSPDGVVRGLGEAPPILGAGGGHAHVHGFASATGFDAGFEQASTDAVPADAERFCESLLALASDIALDEVVDIDRDVIAAHVYNLDTLDGWFIGNGIVTHNCRCALSAATTLPSNLLAPYGPDAGGLTGADLGALDAGAEDVGAEDLGADTAAAAADPEALLAQSLASGIDEVLQLGGGESARTDLITFLDGTKAVRKVDKWLPVEGADTEVLASKLARALGLPAPAAIRDGTETVYMEYIADSRVGADAFPVPWGQDYTANPDLVSLADSLEGRRLGLFDLLIGNTDRNDQNWLIDAEGRLVAIDHGAAFQSFVTTTYNPGEPDPVRELLQIVTSPNNAFAHQLLNVMEDAVGGSRDFSLADLQYARQVLTGLRPEFTALGRDDWYQAAMLRLDWLEPYAGGDGTMW